ncbi:Gfo/Idh/MocA family protein [Flagellimonas allohymeniacidonis]|uniref:Gfo/Idh/MocA family oxidoreductase n=1 Tax=Flagellimonas allohymeniacidonis TaxID=2517819 RepID=A0A4V6MMA2_9FLAO|nr:Gfo/Idh/MocA family oxidoreductase [Allomuricauda hymeniacidonis]TAI47900.1 Gfo/Idh/MocA family oxidoreductase [Allomuricauda hymeniacidonis]
MTESLNTPFFKKSSIRWGVIGCGSVTEKKSVPAYQQTEGFEVAMIMCRNASRAKDYAERHKVPFWTTDARAVIENPEIDAVYIATPPDSHKDYALWVAKAGKPCCIEKPMAPNFHNCEEIYKAFLDRELPLFVAYYRRSLPRFLKIKEWLDTKQIGTVQQIHWVKTKQPNDLDLSGKYNWRTDASIALGGYFDDLASHGLDLFTFLLGPIKSANGKASNEGDLYSAYDTITGSWVHENGVVGKGNWNFLAQNREDSVEIIGTEGRILFSVLDEAPIELITKSGRQSLEIQHPVHIQKYHAENIKKHFKGEGIHPSIGKSGVHTSWVMDSILGKL